MARQFQNAKGFLMIQCTAVEIKRIENGALGLCDNCCLPARQGFLPCVLGHRFFCEKCCSKWMARAVNYAEDKEFEKCVFGEFKSRFVDAGLWEEQMSDKDMFNNRFEFRTPYYLPGPDGKYEFVEFCFWNAKYGRPAMMVKFGPDEQCTGLKDKNGNLIYEGDIVKIGNGSINGEVMESELAVEWVDKIGRWNLPKWTSDTPDWSHYVEIIGNIHTKEHK